ncbi:MAG: hypothetical protein RR478_04300 [Bacilli bacterium]
MVKREKYIDHEDFKVKIKISSNTNTLLQQDMFRFGFLKANEKLNPNLFLNHILPIMDAYRQEEDDKLKSRLIKDKIINDIDEDGITSINNHYYEERFNLCDEVINLRISKENMAGFDNEMKRTSTYLRSLINEYSNLRLDTREFLFFIDEYHLVKNAFNKDLMIRFFQNDVNYEFFPFHIKACPIDNDLFIFGLCIRDKAICIKSVKLCEMNSPHIVNEKNALIINEEIKDNINRYIYDLEYLNEELKQLGGI